MAGYSLQIAGMSCYNPMDGINMFHNNKGIYAVL
jgi:hypothetical protein